MLSFKPVLAITAASSKDLDVSKSKEFVRNLRKKELEWKKQIALRQEKIHSGSIQTLQQLKEIREKEALEEQHRKKTEILQKLELKRKLRQDETNKSQEHMENYLVKFGKPKDRLYARIQETYRSTERDLHTGYLKERQTVKNQAPKPSSIEFKESL